jgi:hypothetical protein
MGYILNMSEPYAARFLRSRTHNTLAVTVFTFVSLCYFFGAKRIVIDFKKLGDKEIKRRH